MFTVIAQYDSCDPVVHGSFKTRKQAEKKVVEVINNFDDYDRNHCENIVIAESK